MTFYGNVAVIGKQFEGKNTTKWTRFTGFLRNIEITFQPFEHSKAMGRS